MTNSALTKKVIARALLTISFGLGFATAAVAAHAGDGPVAEISATVTSEVQQNQVRIVLFAQVQASTATQVTKELTEKIDEASRLLGQPEDVKISTGAFQAYPTYGDKGKVTGWQGRAELVLTSGNIPAAAAAAEKVTNILAFSGVSFSLTDQARRSEQSDLMESVAKAFKEKAQALAKAFGYSGYRIQKLKVSESGEEPSFRPMMMSVMAADVAPKAELNLLPGTQKVSVTVSGLIELH